MYSFSTEIRVTRILSSYLAALHLHAHLKRCTYLSTVLMVQEKIRVGQLLPKHWNHCQKEIRSRFESLFKHIVFFYGAIAPSGPWPPHCQGFTITLRCTTIVRTPLNEWSARRRDLYLTTLPADIHAPSGIRIRNPSKREAADPRLRPLATGIGRPIDYCRKLCSPVRIFKVLTMEIPQV